jgi:hypothetical protein
MAPGSPSHSPCKIATVRYAPITLRNRETGPSVLCAVALRVDPSRDFTISDIE